MWVEHSEGYVVNASDSVMMPEVMSVKEFPNRGKWTLVIVPKSCESSGEAHFTANLSLRNIALPEFEVSKATVNEGQNVTLTVNSEYENITAYFFDYGDGTDSGWIEKSSVSKEYGEKGIYSPKAMVMYSDGTESDWVEVGDIEVLGEKDEVDLFLIARMTILFLVIITILMFLLIRKRKGISGNSH
jgi:hypothetical protein